MGGKEKEWTDCVAEDVRAFGIGGDWKAAALERGAWDDTVIAGGRRFMAGWRKEEESAAITRQRKREAEEADKVVVASGVTVGQLRRFRAALWTFSSAFEATTAASVRDAEDPLWHENTCCIDLWCDLSLGSRAY